MLSNDLLSGMLADVRHSIVSFVNETGAKRLVWEETVKLGWRRLKLGGAEAYNALYEYGLFGGTEAGTDFYPNLMILSGEELQDVFDVNIGEIARHKIGKNTHYLTMPLWKELNLIGGFAVFKKNNNIAILRSDLISKNDPIGVGCKLSCFPKARKTLIFTNPVHAAFYTYRCSRMFTKVSILYAPPELGASTSSFTNSHGVPIVLSEDYAAGLKMSTRIPGSKYLKIDPILFRDMMSSSALEFEHYCDNQSEAPHKTIIDFLKDASEIEGISLLGQLSLTKDDILRVVNESNPEDRKRIENIVFDNPVDYEVSVFDKNILCKNNCWYCDDVLVSNATFQINQIAQLDNGDTQVSGEIYFNTKVLKFASSLKDIQRNTLDWLQNQILANNCGIPNINRRFSKLLYDISIAIHAPIVKSLGRKPGWDKQESIPTFCMPQFLITKGGFSPIELGMYPNDIGVNVEIPQPFTDTELDDLLTDTPQTKVFWITIGYLLYTVINKYYEDTQYPLCFITETPEKFTNYLNALRIAIGSPVLEFSKSKASALNRLKLLQNFSPAVGIVDYAQWHRMPALYSWLKLENPAVITAAKRIDAINFPTDVNWITYDIPNFTYDARYATLFRYFWLRLEEMIISDKIKRQNTMITRNYIEALMFECLNSIKEQRGNKAILSHLITTSKLSLVDKTPLERVIATVMLWVTDGTMQMASYTESGLPKPEDSKKVVYDSVQYYLPRDEIITRYTREGFLPPSTSEIEKCLKTSDPTNERSFKLHNQHWWVVSFAEAALQR